MRWNTRTQRETDGTEPIRRTGHTEPAAYLTSPSSGPPLGFRRPMSESNCKSG